MLISIALITGCTKDISEVKSSDYEGKKVTVSGTVDNTIKIGTLSGYTLKDDTGSISVSSEILPAKGDTITVSGTLIRDTIFGYYIKTN